MTLLIEVLSEEQVNPEVMAYISRMLQNIQSEIDGVNGVAIRQEIPERPREGVIYYLTRQLNDEAVEGFYVYVNEEWKRLAYDL